jgi:hypothetical protein
MPMPQESPWWFSLIVAFLPLLAMIGSAAWVGRRIAYALVRRDGKPVSQVIDAHRQELKRVNDAMERLLSGH